MISLRAIDGRDLDEILSATRPLWEQMRGQRLLLTGGTGFFGKWLLESFLHANRSLHLGAEVTVLTRRPGTFATEAPHLADDAAVTLVEGDVRDFDFPAGEFAFVIHAATEASAWLTANRPREMLATIVDGTERVLRFAEQAKTSKFLLTSSGAVYGTQPPDLIHVPEEFYGAPDCLIPGNVYGEGKRLAEMLCAIAGAGMQMKIARCFAFVGPHLPLDAHFAVGNFLADALAGRTIAVGGDGTAFRSYLYASDLAIWLWTLLFEGEHLRAYNVGSEEAVSIGNLAKAVATSLEPPAAVRVSRQAAAGAAATRYVPSTARARQELGLHQSVSLEEALRRTLAWHRLES